MVIGAVWKIESTGTSRACALDEAAALLAEHRRPPADDTTLIGWLAGLPTPEQFSRPPEPCSGGRGSEVGVPDVTCSHARYRRGFASK